MATWPLYYFQFFTFNADLKWKSFHCYFIPFNHITTKFCTCHDSTAVMAYVKFCSDYIIKHGSKMEIPSNSKIMTGKITCEMGHWQCWHKGVSLLPESMKPSEIMTQNQWLFKTLSGTIDKFHYSLSWVMFSYTFWSVMSFGCGKIVESVHVYIRGPFSSKNFPSWLKFDEKLVCCNLIFGHLIATDFCTCHDSTAVVSFEKNLLPSLCYNLEESEMKLPLNLNYARNQWNGLRLSCVSLELCVNTCI